MIYDVIMLLMGIHSQAALSMKSVRSTKSGKSTSSAVSGEAGDQGGTAVGFYKGNMVAIRNIECDSIALTRDNLMELKAVRNILHSPK